MQMLCMRHRITTGGYDQQGSQGNPRHSSIKSATDRWPLCINHSTCRCPTHEMWELPTPLIVANRSQQGEEVYGSYPLVLKQASWLLPESSGFLTPGKKSSGQEQERTEQEKMCTRADDKRKLEISSRAVANKSSRVEEETSSKKRPAQCKPEWR
ncbi:S-adenosyl-L-methionine-dependent tRNA 4-demethylwyosine synthase [Dorcoceras hygrometricum]|uniref:S-adenosyl-L-methionine-dependent tRNA 4-demethylwyosine synthase n=1 Tax=Dorcoceras hygrometricum TaxID=472368 RepID=A0A2Z7AQ27_9LAMI|nr:S-adenosyl-L-methionine-dependent tRNA 4-demethylwyosine synthase [Dorcoceras hygrometricum]